jgi:hypothetical protein
MISVCIVSSKLIHLGILEHPELNYNIMNYCRCLFFSMIFFLPGLFSAAQQKKKNKTGQSQQIHGMSDELKQFVDFSTMPVYMQGASSAQVSSYDTTGGNDDGFNGKYSFLRRNTDSSLVIFEQAGPGVITRIWTPTPTEDTLDFYIDNNTRPTFSIRFIDLFSGRNGSFQAPLCGHDLGGYYCYLPILFQKSCRIVTRGKIIRFHQIQYRLYEKSTILKSFQGELSDPEKELISRIKKIWNKDSHTVQDFIPDDNELLSIDTILSLTAGKSIGLFNLEGGGRLLGIEFRENQADKKIFRQVDLKIAWDNEKNPAVYCPISDFFGYAFSKPSMQSLLLGYNNNVHYCYYPMPFDHSASIELISRDTSSEHQQIAIRSRIYYSRKKRIAASEGKFYTSWNNSIHHFENKPHVFLHTKGRGHYVGSILQARGLNAGVTYFFEGDDSTVVDGKMNIHGTGSEDYFNGGWYALPDRWDSKLSLPLHGSLDYSLTYCRTGGYRLYLTDKIPFAKEIFQSMEYGPANNNIPAEYTSLALYYCDQGPASVNNPLNENTRINIPDTLMIYPQLLPFISFGKLSFNGRYVGDNFIITAESEDPLMKMMPEEIPFGRYEIFADITKDSSGCLFSFWQRQSQISEWISAYSNMHENVSQLYLGTITMNENCHTMSLQFKTSPGKTKLRLNRFILVRIKE